MSGLGVMRDYVFPFVRYWPKRCVGLNAAALYDTPDRLLTLLQLSPEEMIQGYQQLLDKSIQPQPFWGVELQQPPAIEPLSAAVIRLMLNEFPQLLDSYQAVDRRRGGDGDHHYLERLNRALNSESLLQAFCNVGDLRRELDDQLQLVHQQRQQLDEFLLLQQQSQKILDNFLNRSS